MKKDTNLRFTRPFYLNAGKARLKGLKEVFSHASLDDLRYDIAGWQETAMCNKQGVYETGAERENLIDFIEELVKLAEAFYILYARKNRRQLNHLPKPARKAIRNNNRTQYLTGRERARPEGVVLLFTQTFSFKYSRAELLDLLDAVVTYEGPRTICKTHLVLLYRQLDYLVRLAYNQGKPIRCVNTDEHAS